MSRCGFHSAGFLSIRSWGRVEERRVYTHYVGVFLKFELRLSVDSINSRGTMSISD